MIDDGADFPPVMVVGEAWRRETASCGHCDLGHRRLCGIHIPTQRKGMIPAAPCRRVAAVNTGAADARPWLAVADGVTVRTPRGVPRSYATAHAAYRAARRASQDQEAT